MRLTHLQHFAPICPSCKRDYGKQVKLQLQVRQGDQQWVEEGVLFCSECRSLYPIIHGVPILVPDVQTYLSNSQLHLLWDDRLSFFTQQWLAESSGPASGFELTRQYLSTYCWTHYGDLDPELKGPPSYLLNLVDNLQTAETNLESGLHLEIGCSVGRSTFEVAKQNQQPTLGIDINFSMIRTAQRILRQKHLRYGLRKVGITYKWREYQVSLEGSEFVDFWVADALCLPFSDKTIQTIHSMNVLDCVSDPLQHLKEMSRVQKAGGKIGVVCPYDWSPNATEYTSWMGGRNQMQPLSGSSDEIIRWVLSEQGPLAELQNTKILYEQKDLPWAIRIHDRSVMHYKTHLLVFQSQS